MKRSFVAGASALVFAATMSAQAPVSLAADIPQAAPPPAPAAEYIAPAPANWAGLYFGVLGTYLNGDVDTSVTDPEVDGFGIGAIAGYNAQIDNWVLGLEGDWSWTNADGTQAPMTAEYNWLASVRGRVGYAFDSVLVYGAGGAAFADLDVSAGGRSDSSTQVGWTLGAGVEALLTENVTGRLEYGYYDFGSETYTLAAPVSVEAQLHTIRAALTYKFNY